MQRRDLLKTICAAGTSVLLGQELHAQEGGSGGVASEATGVLVDTTKCLGCRMCERACAEAHRLPEPESTVDLARERMTSPESLTVVNEYETERGRVTVKRQCMHCLQPACGAACLTAEFIEFSPAVAEWLGWRRVRKVLGGLTLGAVVFGITLSTLHQSGLGALYLMARDKIHPLWYSEFIPFLFLVLSIFAGLSLVIFEGSITHRVFHHRVGVRLRRSHDDILIGLARICAGTMFVYLFMEFLVFVHGQHWALLSTGWGAWYLLEVLGFVALPAGLFLVAFRSRNLLLLRGAAAMTLIGILLSRLNVSTIAFKWYAADHYVPNWQEIVVSLAVVSAEIWVFRWVVNRMPVLAALPEIGRDRATDQRIKVVA